MRVLPKSIRARQTGHNATLLNFNSIQELIGSKKLRALLIRLLDIYASNKFSEQDLEYIFEVCRRIALLHIETKSREKFSGHGSKTATESSQDDAASSIAKLFCPISSDGNPPLANAWLKFRRNGHTDEKELLQHMINFVRVVAGQQRSEMLKLYYPQEAKVRRSLRKHISNNCELKIICKKTERYIMPIGELVSLTSPAGLSDLRRHCFNVFAERDSLSRMTKKAIGILHTCETRINCIKLNDLVRCIIEYRAVIFATHQRNSEQSSSSVYDKYLNLILKKRFLRELKERIWSTYVNSGKIDKQTGIAYLGALYTHFRDLLQYGSADSLKRYLAKEIPDLSKEDYTNHHKTRLAYMAGEIRSLLFSETKNELSRA